MGRKNRRFDYSPQKQLTHLTRTRRFDYSGFPFLTTNFALKQPEKMFSPLHIVCTVGKLFGRSMEFEKTNGVFVVNISETMDTSLHSSETKVQPLKTCQHYIIPGRPCAVTDIRPCPLTKITIINCTYNILYAEEL